MNNFIKLTFAKSAFQDEALIGKPCYINVNTICQMYKYNNDNYNHTVIMFACESGNEYVCVKETPEEILDIIAKTCPPQYTVSNPFEGEKKGSEEQWTI